MELWGTFGGLLGVYWVIWKNHWNDEEDEDEEDEDEDEDEK